MNDAGPTPSTAADGKSVAMAGQARFPAVRSLLLMLGWITVYVAFAVAGFQVAVVHRTISPVWPAAGFAVALLTLGGFRLWMAVAFGALLAHVFFVGNPLPVALAIACANTLEALAGAAILRRSQVVGEVARVRDAITFIATSLVAPVISATSGVTSLSLAGFSSWDRYLDAWLIWWLGDVMGILLVTPLLLAWAGKQAPVEQPARKLEFLLAMASSLALVSICYWKSDALNHLGVPFLPPTAFLLPPVIWAVLRLRPREGLAVVALASGLALAYTVLLARGPVMGPLLWLQMLLFVVTGGSLLFIGATTERLQAQQALHRKEVRFRTVFDQAAMGIALVARDGRLLAANPRLCEILGYSREELLGRSVAEVSDPGFPDPEQRLFSELFAEKKSRYMVEKRYRRKDGTAIWVRITSSLLQDVGSAHCISIVEDISMSRRAEAALRQSEERLRYVTEAAEVGYWDWDLTSDRIEWSDRCKAIFGIPPSEPVTYASFLATVSPEERGRVAAAVQKAVDGGGDYDVEFRVVWPCGSDRWVHAKGRVAFDSDGRPVRMAGVALDITARRAMEDAVRRLSQHDALTGLPNRALIYEYAGHLLAQARRDGERVAFLFVDLDRFKPINDTYGHDAGDIVLKEVAKRLSDCVRGEDFVGRLGGDEFLAVLSHIHSADNAAKVALHALVRLDLPLHVDGVSLQVTPSIGLSLFPDDGETVEELIKNADTAMYHAKECGRDNFQFFRPELNARAERALAIEGRLRRALEFGEFQLYFQPVVELASGRPWAAEALLRWPGMDAEPQTFISVAESAGLMQSVGGWVLREACRQQRRWLDKGLPLLPVAVNVSAAQFRDKEFAHHVATAIHDAGLESPGLRLELTESTVMGQVEATEEMLPMLHDMGVKVAVDNFGTGLSNMDRLSHLPLDILKLDRTFVRAIGRDPRAVAVIEAILALARSLGLEVVAEGVETEEARVFLRQRHCPFGQGFLFSKPLPAQQFEEWYRHAAVA